MPTLTSIVFTSSDGVSKEKLRVLFNPAARTDAFIQRRVDANFQIKIMSLSGDPSVLGTFSWKFEDDVYFQPETTIKASDSESGARALTYYITVNNAQVEVNTGVYVFWDVNFKSFSQALAAPDIQINDVYSFSLLFNEGASFDEGDSNTAHQERECSGRGSCDPVSGKCSCPVGYTGVACERSELPRPSAVLHLLRPRTLGGRCPHCRLHRCSSSASLSPARLTSFPLQPFAPMTAPATARASPSSASSRTPASC